MASADAGEGQTAEAPRAVVSHVIFDMDGLLIDTEGFYTEVQEKILARYGKVFDWSLKAKMMGKKATESARIFVEECGLTGLLTPEQFLEERESMLQELFPSCAVLPELLLLTVDLVGCYGGGELHLGVQCAAEDGRPKEASAEVEGTREASRRTWEQNSLCFKKSGRRCTRCRSSSYNCINLRDVSKIETEDGS